MKTKLSLIVILTTLLFAACGGDTDPEVTPTPNPGTVTLCS